MGSLFLILLLALHLLKATIASPTASPIVDLGYTLQQGTLSVNDPSSLSRLLRLTISDVTLEFL